MPVTRTVSLALGCVLCALVGPISAQIVPEDLDLQSTYSSEFFAEDHWSEWFPDSTLESQDMWLSGELLATGSATGTTTDGQTFSLQVYFIPNDFADHRFPFTGAYQKLTFAEVTLTTASGAFELLLRVENYYSDQAWIGTRVRPIADGGSALARHGHDLVNEPEFPNGDPNPYFFEVFDADASFELSTAPPISDAALFATLAALWPPLQCAGQFDPNCVQRALAKARQEIQVILQNLDTELAKIEADYGELIQMAQDIANAGKLEEQMNALIVKMQRSWDFAKRKAWAKASSQFTLVMSQLHRDLQACCH